MNVKQSNYVYGGKIKYKNKDIVIFLDRELKEKVFYQIIDGKYIQVEEQIRIYLDSIYNRKDGILYAIKNIKTAILSGILTITIFLGPSSHQTLSLQSQNPYNNKKINKNITHLMPKEVKNEVDKQIQQYKTEENISDKEVVIISEQNNETKITEDLDVEFNEKDLKEDPLETSKVIESTVDTLDGNKIETTKNETQNNQAGASEIGSKGIDHTRYSDKEYIDHFKNHQYNSVEDLINAIKTNPNLNDEHKKVLLKFENLFKYNKYFDYNQVGYNLNTVKIMDAKELKLGQSGLYDPNHNIIYLYDEQSLSHEMIHCINRWIKIEKEDYTVDSGLDSRICGFSINEGMTELLNKEFYYGNIDCYQSYITEQYFVKFLIELLDSNILLESSTTGNVNLIIDNLTDIYGDREDAISLLTMMDDYTLSMYGKEIDRTEVFDEIIDKLSLYYKAIVKKNLKSEDYNRGPLSLFTMISYLDNFRSYYSGMGPEFEKLYDWTIKEYRNEGKDFSEILESSLQINMIENHYYRTKKNYYYVFEKEEYILEESDENYIPLDSITIQATDDYQTIKSR